MESCVNNLGTDANVKDGSAGISDLFKDRAKDVFRFLTEVKRLASPTISDFESYEHVIWLSDIPREKGCFTKAWEVIGQPSEETKGAWIQIEKPRLSAPPELPDGLEWKTFWIL